MLANLTPLTRRLTLAFDVPDQVLKDILCSSLEGGSNYWLACERVERDEKGDYLRVVKPCDYEESTRTKRVRFPAEQFKEGFDKDADITLDTVLKGIQLVLDGALPKRTDLRGNIVKIQSDERDFDAGDADVFVQLGYFGNVVYG